MLLNHRLLKDSGDRICINTPSFFKQLKIAILIILSVSIFIAFFYFCLVFDQDRPIPYKLFTHVLIGLSILGVFTFGFEKKYTFDLRRKEVIIEGAFFFIPFSKTFCPFDRIATFGIKCKVTTYHKRGFFPGDPTKEYSYYLVFSTKDKPMNFIELVSTTNIVTEIDLNDLNELGEYFAEILKCGFIKGEEKMTLSNENGQFQNKIA